MEFSTVYQETVLTRPSYRAQVILKLKAEDDRMSRGLVTVQMDQIFIGSPQKSPLASSKDCQQLVLSSLPSSNLDKFPSSMIIALP